AIAAGFVVTVDGAASRVAFRHAIAQRTLYEANTTPRRAALHRRVAVAMQERARDDITLADAAELARQWWEAGAAHRAAARFWSGRAGRLALQQFAYDAAAVHLEQAVALARGDDEREQLALLLDLATAHIRAANAVRGREVTMQAVELARK